TPQQRPLRVDLLAGLAQALGTCDRAREIGEPDGTPPPVEILRPVGRPAGLNRLSPREREVASLIAQGDTNRQIARTLNVKENTVEVHVGHILRKLDVRSRAAVARIVALSEGIAGQPPTMTARVS